MRLRDFGLWNGINEVIVITKGEKLNTAPIGIIVENEDGLNAKAKLYASHTRQNLEKGSFFIANIIRDPIIFAISTFEDLSEEFFESLSPPVIKGSLAYCEFEVKLNGLYADLRLLNGKIIRNELRAVNRGFNAVIEALIYATRLKMNPKLAEKIRECYEIIEKCGGEKEKEAMEIIKERIGIR
ncbi:MAG: DUF447 family protein [Archaeoglobaceae archaeon]|nr:DUF447 family protein [Archaeoglobaceae archaeon]MDW8128096.1 DUF447 family protein [Archaeoglobaceae archaeon]